MIKRACRIGLVVIEGDQPTGSLKATLQTQNLAGSLKAYPENARIDLNHKQIRRPKAPYDTANLMLKRLGSHRHRHQ